MGSVFDDLTERLAWHVDAHENLVAGRTPSIHTTFKNSDVIVTECRHARRCTGSHAVTGSYEHGPGRSPWDQESETHFKHAVGSGMA